MSLFLQIGTPTPTLPLIPPEELQIQSHLITFGAGLLVLIILIGLLWNARRMGKKIENR